MLHSFGHLALLTLTQKHKKAPSLCYCLKAHQSSALRPPFCCCLKAHQSSAQRSLSAPCSSPSIALLQCDMDDGGHDVGHFVGSLRSLQDLTVDCDGDAFFEGLADTGSSLTKLAVTMPMLSPSVSQSIASLDALHFLTIIADSCDAAPLASLRKLEALVILPCSEEKEDVSIHGLSEGVAGMQELSYLQLPRAPNADVVLPRTLVSACFGTASMSDVIRLASCAELPALQVIEGCSLHFMDVKNMSDAHRAGAVLSSRWQPGMDCMPIKFENVYGVSCLDAFLHIFSCIPNYRCWPLKLLTTTDIKSNSWDKIGDFGVSVSGASFSTQASVPGFHDAFSHRFIGLLKPRTCLSHHLGNLFFFLGLTFHDLMLPPFPWC